jgi:uncharacterized protein HemX
MQKENREKSTISVFERVILGAIAMAFGTGGGYTGLSFANTQQTKEIAAVQKQADQIEESIQSIERGLKQEIRTIKKNQEDISDKFDDQAKTQAKFERSLGKIEGMLEILIRKK